MAKKEKTTKKTKVKIKRGTRPAVKVARVKFSGASKSKRG